MHTLVFAKPCAISGTMPLVDSILLLLTLLLSGGYAGLVLMCQIGLMPGLREVSLRTYAEAWLAIDRYMDRRMPPYKGSLLLLNAALIVSLVLHHKGMLAAAASLSLLCSVAGLAVTIRKQFPLNARIKELQRTAPDGVLLDIRNQTAANFPLRLWLAAGSFASLCVGAIFWPVC